MKFKLITLCSLALFAVVGLVLVACQHSGYRMHYPEVNAAADFLNPQGAGLGRWEAQPEPGAPRSAPATTIVTNPNDEIWIIVKPQNNAAARQPPEGPGSGAMLAVKPPRDGQAGEPELLPMPLKYTDVNASVTGYIATVDVTQQFHNPFGEKIEAVYQFPLPHDAAVSRFEMTIGDRRIQGVVREKEEAEALYNQARSQGLRASLLTQVRPNIFEQKVANIEPGKQIDVSLRYFNTLSYSDGWYTFAFPMVVAPRYNPAYTDHPVIPRGGGAFTPPANNSTVTRHLNPNERTAHDIAVTLNIDAGVSIEEAKSVTHAVETRRQDDQRLQVTLAPLDRLANKDFVYRFRVAGQTMKQGLITQVNDRGEGYFTLMLYPPADLEQLQRQPMEMVFVLDCSGSMAGEPMQQSKDAMRYALRALQPGDTFQIIRFSDNASHFGNRPVPVTPANIRDAINYVNSLSGSGGTRMIEGLKASLDFPQDPQRHRTVTFLTDGLIGNEREILEAMAPRLGNARVFSFGVGSSTNRYLLEAMAKTGNGAAAYLLPGDSGADVMRLYFERVSQPAMTDLAIDFGNASVNMDDVYPRRLPDLLVGRPVIVTGKFDPRGGDLTEHTVRVIGKAGGAGGERVALTFQPTDARREAAFGAESGGNFGATSGATSGVAEDALSKVWARRRIADLVNRGIAVGDGERYAGVIRETALRHQIMSAYTAFLAVDASKITEGDYGVRVQQPVPMPDGVRYDTTVGDK